MKIITLNVKNLDKLVKELESKGYSIEHGSHAVLLDHSELTSFRVRKNGKEYGVFIIHYITPYYRVEASNIVDDEEYLRRLIEIRHSGEKWGIPVNPIYAIIFNDEIINFLENYNDDYPVKDGEELVNVYRRRNPNYKSIPYTLLAKILDELRH
ncbi:MAG: hypothetical protein B6U89_00725 [Desulfurococcales archaeon ex4484_58]|nr:MAG: hypothetical protein B6U89_00725 [Desulfurococcales archaeon ex4484_58]